MLERSVRYEAILFDMDNTLLRSSIDFPRLKREVFALLVEAGVVEPDFPLQQHTIATLIEEARRMERFEPQLERVVWNTVARGEREGMHGAGLEPYAVEVLERLKPRFRLAVLTNNAYEAAVEALTRTGIMEMFDYVAAREHMTALKPSPSGVLHVLEQFPELHPGQWLSVGDSWIDGRAASDAGVAFVSYNAKEEELSRRGVTPVEAIRSLTELLKYI